MIISQTVKTKTIFLILSCLCMSFFVFDLQAQENEDRIILNLELDGFEKYAGQVLEVRRQAPLFVNGEKYNDKQWRVESQSVGGFLKITSQETQTHSISVPSKYNDDPLQAVHLYLDIPDGKKVEKFINLNEYKNQNSDSQYDINIKASELVSLKEFNFSIDTPEKAKEKYGLEEPYNTRVVVSKKTKSGGLNPYFDFYHEAEPSHYAALLPKGEYWIFIDKVLEGEEEKDINIRSSYTFSHKKNTKVTTKSFQFIPLEDTHLGRSASDIFMEIFEDKSTSKKTKKILKTILKIINHSDRETYIEFFAGYCGPCLSKDGLPKLLSQADKGKGINVIGLHSDSYELKPWTPQSEKEMWSFLKEKPRWKHIKAHFLEEANPHRPKHSRKHLLFDGGGIAKYLSVSSYPTVLTFDEQGVLIEVE